MARRTGYRIYEVDGVLVADPAQPVSGQETGTTPGSPVSLVGNGSAPTLITGGNLGASYTLALASNPIVWLTGTLTANCAITVTGLTAKCSAVLLLSQDSTGGRTLTINGAAIAIPSAASAFAIVQLWSPDGTTIDVLPGPQVGPPGTQWFTGSGAPGTVVGAVTGDYYIRTSTGEVYRSTSGNNTWADQGFSLVGPQGPAGSGGELWLPSSGKYLATAGQNPTYDGFVPSTGYTYCVPFPVPSGFTAASLGINITTAASAGGVVRLGIYHDSGSMAPAGLLLDAGTVVATATGFVEAAISQALTAGIWWLAFCAEVAACHTYSSNHAIPIPGPQASLFTGKTMGIADNGGTTGALPATFVPTYYQNSTGGGAAPHIVVKAA